VNHPLFVVLGAFLGGILALTGWAGRGGKVAFGTSVVTGLINLCVQLVKAFRGAQADGGNGAEKAFEFASKVGIPDYASAFSWGFVGGFMALLAGAWVVVFLPEFWRKRGNGWNEAIAAASMRATYLTTFGVKQFLERHDSKLHGSQTKWGIKRAHLQSLYLTGLNRAMNDGDFTDGEFRALTETLGATFLTYVFEDGAQVDGYRFALYRSVDGGDFEFVVGVARTHLMAHSGKPVPRKSFLGAAVDENRLLVFPRDKTRKRAHVKRSGGRYQSFAAVPLPRMKNSNSVWGLTIDFVGKDSVFTRHRLDAAKELAHFVGVMRQIAG